MTCTLTDGARKFRRWHYYRPTRLHLEGQVDSSRLTRSDSQVYSLFLLFLLPGVINTVNCSQVTT